MKSKPSNIKINLQKVGNGFIVVEKFEPKPVEEKMDYKIKIPRTFIQTDKVIQQKPKLPEPCPDPIPPPKQIPPINTHQINIPPQQKQIPQKQNPQLPPNYNQQFIQQQYQAKPQWLQQTNQVQPPMMIPHQMPQQQMPPPQQVVAPPPPPPPPIIQPEKQPEVQTKRQPTKYQLVVPSCAAWFQLDSINQIEKDQFPEFFSGQHVSKTPELYKKYRNFIVSLYRSSPHQYLTTTACRKVLAGDACTISRIHGFLQFWGIINYSIDPETCPNKVLPQQPITKGLYRNLQLNTKDELDEKTDLNQTEIALLNTIKAFSKKYRPTCSYCGILCGLIWYCEKDGKNNQEKTENSKEPENKLKLSLCSKCFSQNNFPQSLTSEDFQTTNLEEEFKQIHILTNEPKSTLNDQEVSLLVSIMQENPEANWEKLTQQLNQVFSTSHKEEEVILHFLQYPADHFLNMERLLDSKQSLDKVSLLEISEKIPFDADKTYNDENNLVSFHLAIFQKLLNRYMKKQQMPLEKEEKNEQVKNEQVKNETDLKQEDNQCEEVKRVIQMRDETIARSRQLQKREEEKLSAHINLLISLQMEKLENKLAFLEEYEKLILYEKQQLEVCQKQTLADRLVIVQQKLQLYQDNNQ